MNMIDPTRSRTARDEYTSILKSSIKDLETEIIKTYSKIFIKTPEDEKREIIIFSRTKSYSAKKLEQSLSTKITQDIKSLILRTIKQQFIKGVQMAFKQAKISKPIRAAATGQFISQGTLIELSNVNIDKVKTIQQRYLERLKTYIASFIGGGSFTWNQLLNEIKRLGNISKGEAERIARTEVIRTISIGQQTTFKKLGIDEWIWITSLDERVCPICGPFHGRKRKIGQPVGSFKGKPIYHPPAHPNCRCGMEGTI